MSYTFIRDPEKSALERWEVEQQERYPKHLAELPSGEYVSPRLVDMIRVSAGKADRSTGEVGAVVHVECKGSWFTVRFDEVDEARGFARCLANLRNDLNDR